MYTPAQHKEDRVNILQSLIRQHPFGAIVTCGDIGPSAEHIPFVLHCEDSTNGTLRGHVARGNPLGHQTNIGLNTLIIFQGPHAYITPSWYPSKSKHGEVVPTWNYVLVHAYGKLKIVHDKTWLREHLETLTSSQETRQHVPWEPDDAPASFIDRMMKGIVGVEIKIDRFQGKWKISQNKGAEDRDGVATGLRTLATDNATAMADLVANENLSQQSPN